MVTPSRVWRSTVTSSSPVRRTRYIRYIHYMRVIVQIYYVLPQGRMTRRSAYGIFEKELEFVIRTQDYYFNYQILILILKFQKIESDDSSIRMWNIGRMTIRGSV